jgi:hypothetical protein
MSPAVQGCRGSTAHQRTSASWAGTSQVGVGGEGGSGRGPAEPVLWQEWKHERQREAKHRSGRRRGRRPRCSSRTRQRDVPQPLGHGPQEVCAGGDGGGTGIQLRRQLSQAVPGGGQGGCSRKWLQGGQGVIVRVGWKRVGVRVDLEGGPRQGNRPTTVFGCFCCVRQKQAMGMTDGARWMMKLAATRALYGRQGPAFVPSPHPIQAWVHAPPPAPRRRPPPAPAPPPRCCRLRCRRQSLQRRRRRWGQPGLRHPRGPPECRLPRWRRGPSQRRRSCRRPIRVAQKSRPGWRGSRASRWGAAAGAGIDSVAGEKGRLRAVVGCTAGKPAQAAGQTDVAATEAAGSQKIATTPCPSTSGCRLAPAMRMAAACLTAWPRVSVSCPLHSTPPATLAAGSQGQSTGSTTPAAAALGLRHRLTHRSDLELRQRGGWVCGLASLFVVSDGPGLELAWLTHESVLIAASLGQPAAHSGAATQFRWRHAASKEQRAAGRSATHAESQDTQG